MSFEKHALGDSSFYLKTGSIYYINTNGALKGQLKELKLKTKKMKIDPELKMKFECFVIHKHNVSKVIDAIPELSAFLSSILETSFLQKTYTWRTPQIDERCFPYQREGILWAIETKNCYIADEMGLGKTVQGIGFMDNSPYRTALVIAPACVVLNWAEEILEWSSNWTPLLLGSKDQIRSQLKHIQNRDHIAYITTWSQLALQGHLFSQLNFELVILDEAHKAKNPDAQCTINAQAVTANAQSTILLSGTPVQNSAIDLWSQLSLITDEFGTFDEFAQRYAPPIEFHTPNGMQVKHTVSTNLVELRKRCLKYMIHRKKINVLKDLPPITHEKLQLILKDKDVYQEWESLTGKAKDGEQIHLASHRKSLGIAKAKAVVDWIINHVSANYPIVIFFVHKDVHTVLANAMNQNDIPYGSIVGKTSKEDRQKYKEEFQTGKLWIMLCSEAGKEGMTLTRSSRLLQLEKYWVPSAEDQAHARVHRIGSENPVLITHAIVHKTMDDLLLAKIAYKRKVIKELFGKELMTQDEMNYMLDRVQI